VRPSHFWRKMLSEGLKHDVAALSVDGADLFHVFIKGSCLVFPNLTWNSVFFGCFTILGIGSAIPI